jgi:hypothetical protein
MSSSSSSSSSEITGIEKEVLQLEQNFTNKQIKVQLFAELDRYRKQKKEELSKIISDLV